MAKETSSGEIGHHFFFDTYHRADKEFIKKLKSLRQVKENYYKLSYEDSLRYNLRMNMDITYDMGKEYDTFTDEFRKIVKSSGREVQFSVGDDNKPNKKKFTILKKRVEGTTDD